MALRTRLVALFSALFLLVAASLVVGLPARLSALATQGLVSRSEALASLLAASVSAAVDFDDPAEATLRLSAVAQTPGAVYARLVRDKETFAGWGQLERRRELPAAPGALSRVEGDLLHLRVPVVSRASVPVALELGVGLEQLRAERENAMRWALEVALAVLALGAVGVFVVGTLVTRPLRSVTEVALRISRGEDAARAALPLGRGDETGELARAFDTMLERLRALNAELERRVIERTAELAKANQELDASLKDLQRTQEQLVAADRRITVGRLAVGVAHEINNPLAYLVANTQYLQGSLKRLEALLPSKLADEGARAEVETVLAEGQEALQENLKGSERVATIVRGLKALGRADEDQRELVDLEEVVRQSMKMAAVEVRHRARLESSFRATPPVHGNAVRLGQVFLNLLLNAAQAIPEGDSSGHRVWVRTETDAQGRAVVEVGDTGCGIPPEVRSKLFTPFFTTKPVGVGTGLGLSISQAIVLAHEGEISVDSREGKGSVFRVVLPPAPPELVEDSRRKDEAGALPRRRILLVDDEPLVARGIQRQLGLQHQVDVCGSGAEALGRLGKGAAYDVVLCDLMMPGMTGSDLHRALGERHPEWLPRLWFMTGGAISEPLRAFVAAHPERCLEKPLKQEELRRVLQSVAS